VDPSVAVLCDVHNTLVNTVLRLYGSKEIQEKWLPDLATSKVGRPLPVDCRMSLLPATERELAFEPG
jgi:hypothetical protein